MVDRNLFVRSMAGVTRRHPLQSQYDIGVVIIDLTEVSQSIRSFRNRQHQSACVKPEFTWKAITFCCFDDPVVTPFF